MLPIYLDEWLHLPEGHPALQAMASDLVVADLGAQAQQNLGYRATKPTTIDLSYPSYLDGYVAVPRGFFNHPALDDALVEDLRPDEYSYDFGAVDAPWSTYPLRTCRDNDQFAAIQALHGAWLSEDTGALLEMGTGRGKTTCFLLFAHCVNTAKTLVVVDRTFLLDQWTKEAMAVFGFGPGDIGRIQGKPDTWTIGAQITIAMAHTLALYPDAIDLKQFGLVGFDEIHAFAAPNFLSIIPRVTGFRVGLTASVERQDGLHPCFQWHLCGPKATFTCLASRQAATWVMLQTPAYLTEAEQAECYRRVPGKYVMKRDERGRKTQVPMLALVPSKLDAYLSTKMDWVDAVAQACIEATRKGRRVLVLDGGTAFCETLVGCLQTYDVNAHLVIGKTKAKDRERAFAEAEVIVATEQLAGKGLDVKNLSVLILTMPTTNPGFLRQAKGRADRADTCKPVVLVFQHQYMESLAKKSQRMIPLIEEIDPGCVIKYRKAKQ